VREVFNYVSAMDHVLEPQRELPLNLRLLRDAHRTPAGAEAELLGHWLASSPAPQALREQPHLR
jgi:hypothetical protein